MRELEAIEVTTNALEPGCEQTLLIGQSHAEPILLSHFEVTELCTSTQFRHADGPAHRSRALPGGPDYRSQCSNKNTAMQRSEPRERTISC